MDLTLLVKGMITGFVIAAPVGPIGVLCVQRTLSRGRQYGLASGIGAAAADFLCAFVAGFGMYVIEQFINHHQGPLKALGGLILLGLGLRTFLTRPDERCEAIDGLGMLRAFTSVFFLALTNPITILSIAALFVAMGVRQTASGSVYPTFLLASGVFGGSALWWVILSATIGLLDKKFNHQELKWINRIAGALLIGCGVLIFADMILR